MLDVVGPILAANVRAPYSANVKAWKDRTTACPQQCAYARGINDLRQVELAFATLLLKWQHAKKNNIYVSNNL